MGQGRSTQRRSLGVVSIFADDADGPEFKSMLAIINSLELKPKTGN